VPVAASSLAWEYSPSDVGVFPFEGSRGWASDSLSIRSFVRIALDERVPDHSTISRTRRLMDVETHQSVFQCWRRWPKRSC
jgi:hypothetical protein